MKTQRAVLEKLEINKLHAVIGASLGGLQAYEWAAAHSDMVERIIPVFAPGWITQAVKTLKDEWKAPILNDPEWNGGNYNPRFTPLNGLVETMKLVTENARHPDFFQLVLPQISTLTKAEWLKSNAKTRASTGDANNFLYLASAVQAFKLGHDDGLKAIKQPVLMIYSKKDQIITSASIKQTETRLKAGGAHVTLREVVPDGVTWGHLDCVRWIHTVSDDIADFLNT